MERKPRKKKKRTVYRKTHYSVRKRDFSACGKPMKKEAKRAEYVDDAPMKIIKCRKDKLRTSTGASQGCRAAVNSNRGLEPAEGKRKNSKRKQGEMGRQAKTIFLFPFPGG